jgi:hypothetical protein
MQFYIGLHQPSDAEHFERCMISIHRLQTRRKPVACQDVLIDSGAFSTLATHGGYPTTPAEYAAQLRRLRAIVPFTAAVAQDYMCEPFMLRKTGLTVERHQRLTIDRYVALRDSAPELPIMPVLQGYTIDEYISHVEQYGSLLEPGAWCGVGSVCKRNTQPRAVGHILRAIHNKRPDLRLHGFGLKSTALESPEICEELYSSDSMAWSFSARRQGRNGNDYREAIRYQERIQLCLETPKPVQLCLTI